MTITMDNMEQERKKSTVLKKTDFEEALLLTGYGKYNYGLVSVCSFTILAMGMDLYAMSLVVPAAACDLKLTQKQKGILSAISFVGVIISSHMWGYLSDTRGRRYIMIRAMSIGFAISFLSGFSPNWIVLAVLKLLTSACTTAANSAVYTLLGECSPAHSRNRALLIMASFLAFAQGSLALIAWPLIPLSFAPPIDFLGITYRPWRLLIQLIAMISGISALSFQFFHESPKFLASQGRLDEALAVLKKIYATNTGDKAENYPVHELCYADNQVSKNTSVLRSMWEQTVPLFQRPLLSHTLKIYYILIVVFGSISAFLMWFPTIVNSYINAEAAGTASGNNLCASWKIRGTNVSERNGSIVEVVCNDQIQDVTVYITVGLSLVFAVMCFATTGLVRLIGKKAIVIVSLAVSGVSGIICNLVYNPVVGLVLLVIFQLVCINIGLMSALCVDIYPTKVRGMAVGLSVMVGRLSGFIGINVVGLLLEANCESAFYVFGALLLSGILCGFLLPSESTVKSNEQNDSKT